jgi:CRISPR/Cas system CSM-associated protein Csm2 small subunit
LYTWVRDARTRRWQLEDAKLQIEKAHDLATRVVDDAGKLADKVHSTSEILVNKVSENTKEAKSAFTEANSVNNKIANINVQLLEMNKILTEHSRLITEHLMSQKTDK